MSSVLVLSAENVADLTRSLTAQILITMIGRTMHAVSSDSRRELAAGDVAPIQNPQRISTDTPLHSILYMPARLTTSQGVSLTSVKIVSAPKPGCKLLGLPATTLLFDEETGRVKAVVNAAELTGIRTAAASALATSLLANPQSTRMVVFGTGMQSYYHARLVLQLFPLINSLVFVVRSITARATMLGSRIQREFPSISVTVVPADETSQNVKRADIICCCVPSTSPLFEVEDLQPGAHINAIGSYKPTMQEFPPSLISPSTDPSSQPTIPTILVDSREACLAESGELIASGILPSSIVELGDVVDVAGERIDRFAELGLRKTGRSLFKCVGIGGMDVAIAELIYEMAKGTGVGTALPF